MADLVRADAWRGYRELVFEQGGDPEIFLEAAGVDSERLSNPDAYLPFAALSQSLEIAAERLNCADFGLRLASRQRDLLGPLSTAVFNAESGREALEVAARYAHFHNGAVRMSCEATSNPNEDFVTHEIITAAPFARAQQEERMIAFLHLGLSRACGPEYAPLAVWFRHRALSPLETYRGVFGVTPEFNKPRNGVLVQRAHLDARQPGRSAHLQRLAIAYLDSIGAGGAASVVRRVRVAVGAMIRAGAPATAQDVAHALSLHERTLQRRLKAEGVRFEEIKDEVRRDLATGYLSQRNIPLSRVAELLGYAEPAAFSRACRRWFGECPRTVRIELLAGSGMNAAPAHGIPA